MRYVTITKSRFFNNGSGIVPNALDSEKYPPPEDNVITDNDIFWNNFNYYRARRSSCARRRGDHAVPGRRRRPAVRRPPQRVENNRIYGNYLAGVGAVQQLLLRRSRPRWDLRRQPDQQQPVRAQRHRPQRPRPLLRRQRTDNCFGPNTGVHVDVPGERLDAGAVPVHRRQHFESSVQAAMVNWAVGDPTHQANWIVHPHAPITGLTPLEQYATYTGTKPS